jgi:hypothetical protein
MVSRFLEIARASIARHEGAEIKTEGDAIHAVFPSASSAVMCGLDILDAAAELNDREPDRPLGLGVGVHAGEAVETAEGYIGTAVNVASRVCAAAKPGEILVTSTVKGITQGSIPVGFIARGRRRLKGIREPVDVFAVRREGTHALGREVSRRVPGALPRPLVIVGAAGALAGVIAISAIGGSFLTSSAAATPTPGAVATATPGAIAGKAPIEAPTAQPVALGPLPIGAYASQQFQPPFTFDVTDTGWVANRDAPALFGLIREGTPSGSISLLRAPEVLRNPCVAGEEGATGLGTANVISQFEGLGHVDISNPQPVDVGGSTGQQVDVAIADGALAACGGLVGADVPLFRVGDDVWGASPGERFRLITLKAGDEPLTLALSLDWPQMHSLQELEELFGLGRRVIDSVEFVEASPRPEAS